MDLRTKAITVHYDVPSWFMGNSDFANAQDRNALQAIGIKVELAERALGSRYRLLAIEVYTREKTYTGALPVQPVSVMAMREAVLELQATWNIPSRYDTLVESAVDAVERIAGE